VQKELPLEAQLQNILNDISWPTLTHSPAYLGGSLTWKNGDTLYCVNVGDEGFTIKDGVETPLQQTMVEQYWVAKCYLKYKTSEHCFYEQARQLVELVETCPHFSACVSRATST
jgi:hypothetical protein